MIIKRIRMKLIMGLVIGLIFQSLVLPAYGAESFKLSIIPRWSEIDLIWTAVSGATSYDVFRSSDDDTSRLTTVPAGTLRYCDRSVNRGERYTYWIIARKDDAQLAVSNSIRIVAGSKKSSPSTPTLRAKAFAAPYVELSWGGSGNADYYELQQKTGSQNFRTCATLKTTSYKDYFVNRGITYTYRIKAFNDHGSSNYSKEVTVSIKPTGAVPDVPAGFTGRDDRVYNYDTDKYESSKRIVLSWRYDDTDAQGFIIERKSKEGDYSEIANASPGTNLFTNRTNGAYSYDSSASTKYHYYFDTNVSTDSIYYYRIKAYNTHGESDYAREVQVATWVTRAPAPPVNLKAEASPGRINLKWENTASNAKGVRIERRAESTSTFSEVGSVIATVSSYGDTSFSPNTTYYYRVRAFNDKGSSNYSNEVKVTSLTAPPQITPAAAPAEIGNYDSIHILYRYDSPNATSISKIIFLTTPPITTSAATFLPAGDIGRLMDAAVKWDDAEKKVTFTYKDQIIECWANRNTARINGALIAVDTSDPTVTPFIADQKYMMLPLHFIERAFQCTIDWQPDDRFTEVYINQ